jgi:flagellin-like protein
MKGITPVIAIVLLLLITVAMVGFAFVWFQSTWTDLSASTGEAITSQSEAMMKTVRIDAVSSTSISVRNMGSKDIAAGELAVYVNGEVQTGCEATAIPAGDIASCTIVCATGDTVKATSPTNSDIATCP